MPPGPGASVGVSYGGRYLRGGLEEGGERISERRELWHTVDVNIEIAPIEGVTLVLGFAQIPSATLRYPDARPMLLDPVAGGGTYAFSQPDGEAPEVSGSGPGGIWIGAGFAPFSERYGPSQRITWRLDAAHRTATAKRNLWTVGEKGRGASNGGAAWLLSAAFSSRNGAGDPYLRASWLSERPVTLDIIDESGERFANGLRVVPANTLDIVSGIEVLTKQPEGTRLAVDLFVGFGYRTWQDMPTGIYLPRVVNSAREIPVTASEHLVARAGIGLVFDVQQTVRGRMAIEGRYTTPYRPEHVYNARTTLDTFTIGWTVDLTGIASLDKLTKRGE